MTPQQAFALMALLADLYLQLQEAQRRVAELEKAKADADPR